MRYDVVTIVASRRARTQVCELVAQLPPKFGMPIVCLAEGDARLVAELAACTPLEVKWAQSGDTPQAGCVYVSPPGTSIVFGAEGRIALSPVGPESTAHHPVDSFLITAARTYGNRALAVVLGAFRDDGAEGAHSLKWRGSTVLVLDRATAEYYGMADAIVRRGSFDRILTAGEVAEALRASFTGGDLLANAEIQLELGVILDSALLASGTHMGNIRIAERTRGRLHIVAHRGLGKPYLDEFSVVPADSKLACARAVREGRRVVVENALNDAGYAAYPHVLLATGFQAVQATPVRAEEGASGVVTTFYPFPHTLTMEEADGLDRIAAEARAVVARIAERS
jgi:hypothetical protein